jgi:phosphoribosylformylglycinamidine synthase subunit PurL
MAKVAAAREPEVTEALAEAHGLKPDEYRRILDLLGRSPTFTELGIFSAMWNEHCSYKSSRIHLRTLPTEGPQVIQGPGENAGVVDIGDGQAVVFKMESHNHPSYIEPYQGAATGVGGILRDVFTMGARPIAAMNALSFGPIDHPRTLGLLRGVVSGIGGYANAFGVPTIAASCASTGPMPATASSTPSLPASPIRTGSSTRPRAASACPSSISAPRPGATGWAARPWRARNSAPTQRRSAPPCRWAIPFTEKRLMEACLELMASGAVIAIQDMGAAGLTCSAVEMGDKGGLGVRLDLDRVPVREEAMTAYEMMLSESQERMLMVLRPENEAEARAIFEKWDLDFAVVGETIAEDRFVVRHGGARSRPSSRSEGALGRGAGLRPPARPRSRRPRSGRCPRSIRARRCCARRLAESLQPRLGLDAIRPHGDGDTVVRPGSDAGVVRVHGTRKALAFTADVNPRYCFADPEEGGRRRWPRPIATSSRPGRPLAATDNLNFGNPERPEIMGQLVGCIRGIGDGLPGARHADRLGQRQPLQRDRGPAILPTPTIGGVGLIEDVERVIRIGLRDGLSAGAGRPTRGHLAQSALLADVLEARGGAAAAGRP